MHPMLNSPWKSDKSNLNPACLCTLCALLYAFFVPVARSDDSRTLAKDTSMIIFRSADGRTLTLKDLQGVTGEFRYEIIRSTNIPKEALLLHQQARQAGGQGEYKKAVALLEKASVLAPQWPYPFYDRAYSHLLMNEDDLARKYYRKTLELAPRGFFTAITALD